MELSKEVHSLLERIKKLSQQVHKNESYSETPINVSLNLTNKSFNSSLPVAEEITFNSQELIPVENMDFSDDERWLYVSENSMVNPFTGDLNGWLRQDLTKSESSITNTLDLEPKIDFRKFIDTRTFTRPKKRISRPSLEQIADGYTLLNNSKRSLSENQKDEIKSITSNDVLSDSYQEVNYSGPVHFKLSEPVYNSSFDRILATASDSIDSFQNMSPPSLVNSLCSSTFTTLMDSSYVNHDLVPNEKDSVCVSKENLNEKEEDSNETYIADEKCSQLKELSLNDTYEIKHPNDKHNSTYSMIENDLNATFKKNISNKSESPRYNLSNTSTFTKKSKPHLSSNLTNNFKASCPDINKTFQKHYDCSLDLTFQKFSDSQPNLTEDLKRTILNQSMELMNPQEEVFHSARSESADSLDERSSSISNCSKDSGTKILNVSELDTLAKVQEKKLQQAMSTPHKPSNRLLVMEGSVLSPIQTHSCDELEEYLSRSDSDLSDSCVTARSRFSKHSSPSRSSDETVTIVRSDINLRPRTAGPKPEVMVKPMEGSKRMVQPSRAQTAPVLNTVRPKMRASGLPRPTMTTTGIPRPMSRIPAPKSFRPPSSRPIQRQPPKTDWMDGCY